MCMPFCHKWDKWEYKDQPLHKTNKTENWIHHHKLTKVWRRKTCLKCGKKTNWTWQDTTNETYWSERRD